MKRILVIHGPNLQHLGTREREHYGTLTLDQINSKLQEQAKVAGVEMEIAQSNHEGEIVEIIGGAKGRFDCLIINPAAYTHTSVAIRDAILAVEIATIEVHLSNIFEREAFRQHSYVSDVVIGVISGFGPQSYELALEAAVALVNAK